MTELCTSLQSQSPVVQSFFDHGTFTFSYVVHCPKTKVAAIIDSVLNFDYPSARTSTESADAIIAYIHEHNLQVAWILETHMHADHLTAAPYLQQALGGKIAIGRHILEVQTIFSKVFNLEQSMATDGSQFNHLFADGDEFFLGEIPVRIIHTPGHTPACISYLMGDAVFVGDTLFMPDYGSARCDFPGGDAAQLYQSVQKVFALPDATRMFLCHDYLPDTRKNYQCETTVGEQRQCNIHLRQEISQEEFVNMRQKRDATLAMPQLIIPAVQTNMLAGELPKTESNQIRYFKIPINAF